MKHFINKYSKDMNNGLISIGSRTISDDGQEIEVKEIVMVFFTRTRVVVEGYGELV